MDNAANASGTPMPITKTPLHHCKAVLAKTIR
jgi:hypothetical protein